MHIQLIMYELKLRIFSQNVESETKLNIVFDVV